MKANELRIGNFVLYQEYYIATVHGITDPDYGNGIHVHYDNVRIGCEHGLISGIPLTEEWMRKLGFDVNKRYRGMETVINRFSLWIGDGWDHWEYISGGYDAEDNDFVVEIQYVHQLQNLYFALTGEELTINEEQQ